MGRGASEDRARRPRTLRDPLRTLLVVLAVVGAACATSVPRSSDVPAGPIPIAPSPTPSPSTAPEDAFPTGDLAPGLPASDVALPPLTLVAVADVDAPVATALLADGTVLVAERVGIVRVLLGDEPGRVLLDVRDRTTTDGERGLLAITVTPEGDELVISMTDPAGDTLVEAHPLSGTTITGAPRTIYTLAQPRANHNGGSLAFLADGTLLLGLGDGGGQRDPEGAGQDLTTPLGAIVRLDMRDGLVRIPADNPFVDDPDAAPEIAFPGVRNPWRIAYDDARDELWVADVGQSRREEITRLQPLAQLGANLGWALREGSLELGGPEPEGHVPPLYEYDHGPGCSVTGGIIYRGVTIPGLVGAYVFTDLCDGELRALVVEDGTVVARPLGVRGTSVVGFGTDADGELLVLELGGRVARLAPT